MRAINHFYRHVHLKIYKCWHCWGSGKHNDGETCYVFSIGKNSNVFFIKEHLDDPNFPKELQYRAVFDDAIRKAVIKIITNLQYNDECRIPQE